MRVQSEKSATDILRAMQTFCAPRRFFERRRIGRIKSFVFLLRRIYMCFSEEINFIALSIFLSFRSSPTLRNIGTLTQRGIFHANVIQAGNNSCLKFRNSVLLLCQFSPEADVHLSPGFMKNQKCFPFLLICKYLNK